MPWSSGKGNDHENHDSRIGVRVRAIQHVCVSAKQQRYGKRKFHRSQFAQFVDEWSRDRKRGKLAVCSQQHHEPVRQYDRRKTFAERVDIGADGTGLRPRKMTR